MGLVEYLSWLLYGKLVGKTFAYVDPTGFFFLQQIWHV